MEEHNEQEVRSTETTEAEISDFEGQRREVENVKAMPLIAHIKRLGARWHGRGERHRTSGSHRTPVQGELGAEGSVGISKSLIDNRSQGPMSSIMLTCFTLDKLGSGSRSGSLGAEFH